jgi:hypothetical protein
MVTAMKFDTAMTIICLVIVFALICFMHCKIARDAKPHLSSGGTIVAEQVYVDPDWGWTPVARNSHEQDMKDFLYPFDPSDATVEAWQEEYMIDHLFSIRTCQTERLLPGCPDYQPRISRFL